MNQLWILAAGAAVGGLVQGISGFAFAMVAMAIWVWGVDPQLAAVMAVFGGVTGQIMSAIRIRRGWHLGLLWPFLLGSLIGIPLGTRLLPLLDPTASSWCSADAGRVLLGDAGHVEAAEDHPRRKGGRRRRRACSAA